MYLSKSSFLDVVKNTPLVSIDLLVRNSNKDVLLGRRVNEPAKQFWFVPGGRILKDEALEDAFSRTVKNELGLVLDKSKSRFYGLYEHFYENNVFNDDFSTHYIVLAHELSLSAVPELNQQHSEYRWFNIEALLNNENVHKYTKDYFRKKTI